MYLQVSLSQFQIDELHMYLRIATVVAKTLCLVIYYLASWLANDLISHV